MNEIKNFIETEEKNNRIVFRSIEGLISVDIDEFIKQPLDGILYDLNRLPEVVVGFLDDPKWVNDYAVYLVIKKLYELCCEKNNC